MCCISTELLQDCLEYQAARDEAVRLAVADASHWAMTCAVSFELTFENLGPERARAGADSRAYATAGAQDPATASWRSSCLTGHEFVLDPLPNLVFTRDASFWIGDRGGCGKPGIRASAPGDPDLATIIYIGITRRFAGTKWLYWSDLEHVDLGGDVLLLAPGVVAIGVGERTALTGAGAIGQAPVRDRPRSHGAGGANQPARGGWPPRHRLRRP